MTKEVFAEFAERVLRDVKERLVQKGDEYAKDSNDRLRQFKLMAYGMGLEPEAVCMILADKHWSALKDAFIPRSKFDSPEDESDFVFEIALDVICYMILLYALVEEERMEDESEGQSGVNAQEAIKMVAKMLGEV